MSDRSSVVESVPSVSESLPSGGVGNEIPNPCSFVGRVDAWKVKEKKDLCAVEEDTQRGGGVFFLFPLLLFSVVLGLAFVLGRVGFRFWCWFGFVLMYGRFLLVLVRFRFVLGIFASFFSNCFRCSFVWFDLVLFRSVRLCSVR